jgi:predicted glycogen debranching enzyme
MLRGSQPLDIEVAPLITYRDFHSLTRGGWQLRVSDVPDGIEVRAFEGARLFRILAPRVRFTPTNEWYWNFHHREETARGLDDRSDLYVPGSFSKRLHVGDGFTLVLSTEDQPDADATRALDAERSRQRSLLQRANALEAHPVIQQLTLAADQFIVRRDVEGRPGKTVIAGYHWFNDWGRDTMISLPGLTLSTGRSQDAAGILRTFARYLDQGMLPNNFPDSAGALPGYNTVDATLWYLVAIARYASATGDNDLVDELLPIMKSIIDWHVRGTRYGIGVDPHDGLLRAGEPGVQLTWMDAKVGDWVVTPRIGKPVEIQALWYNALRALAIFTNDRQYSARADQVRDSFVDRYFRPDLGYLADVIDGPNGDELQLRPNQIFAISLPHPLLAGAEAATVVDKVGRALLTGLGLRSLSPDDGSYRGDYAGDPVRRDGGYHQGPVWTWLLGPYAEAHYRVHGDRDAALALLSLSLSLRRPVEDHLRDACLGNVSEILEGDAPHRPVGCVAQAWGVAETLRVLRLLSGESA